MQFSLLIKGRHFTAEHLEDYIATRTHCQVLSVKFLHNMGVWRAIIKADSPTIFRDLATWFGETSNIGHTEIYPPGTLMLFNEIPELDTEES